MKLFAAFLIGIVSVATTATTNYSKNIESKNLRKFQYLNTVETKHYNNNNNKASTRVAGGAPAKRGMFPYQVRLETYRVVDWNYFSYSFCGGSLISENYVLTAAHCICSNRRVLLPDGREVDHITDYQLVLYIDVYLGYNNLSIAENGSQHIRVHQENYILHEDYVGGGFLDDIALLHLPQRAVFNEFVRVINLPSLNIRNLTRNLVTVSGWGSYNEAGNFPDVLQYAKIKVAFPYQCSKIYEYFDGNGQICLNTNDRSSSCPGDSGGPGVIRLGRNDILVGIVSYGPLDGCTRGEPVVCTRVSYYLHWIHEKTNITIQ